MKRCPTCNRSYLDDTQKFCLDDGATLIEEKTSAFDPQATLVIPGAQPTSPPVNPYGSGASQGSPGSGAGQGSYGPGSGQGSIGPGSGQNQQAGSWSPTPQRFSPVPTAPAKKSMLPWILGGAAVLVIGLIGLIVIVAIAVNSSSNSNSSKSTDVVIRSADGKIQVSVPPAWKVATDLNDKAELQVSDTDKKMYLVILTSNKADYSDKDLDTQSSETLDALTKSITSSNKVGPTKLTIDGNPAVQYEVRGEFKNINVVYLHTTVETSKHFQQIVTWTMESTYNGNEDLLKGITQSFKEN
jgi:hypothetical protein